MVVAQDASANAGRGLAAPTPAATNTIASDAARPDFVQILNEPMSPPPGFEVQEFSAIPTSAKYQCRQRCVQTAARVSYCSVAPALLERTGYAAHSSSSVGAEAPSTEPEARRAQPCRPDARAHLRQDGGRNDRVEH